MPGYIPAEIGKGREVHPGGYLRQRQLLLAQEVRNLMQGEAAYPVGGRPAAGFPANLGEVVGSDAEAGGIVGDIPVLDVLQQPGRVRGCRTDPGCVQS